MDSYSRPIMGFTAQMRRPVAIRSPMQVKQRRQWTISSSLPIMAFWGKYGSARRALPRTTASTLPEAIISSIM